ncbi:hypothetical protein CPLU01_03779 [Colletotrichum plurivorum]|uniref:Rhodopsin domain-containing protein n=1 Tax=Colletotrichum plurivorum TaxID=2175906 RepID=A0A8H6NKZ1_9PEZI|nr:hypothetical protein CPLU01_03779 [Colletotrichum plurivorum]
MNSTTPNPPTGNMTTHSLDPHDSRQPLVIGISSVFIGIVTTFMAIRVLVRGYILKGWGLDDYAYIWSCVNATYGALGLHFYDSTPEQNKRSVKYVTAMVILYQFAFLSIKATFFLQYRRAFALPSIQTFCNIFLAINLLILVGMTISGGIVVGRFLAPDVGPADQQRFLRWTYANAGINLTTDIIIFILPLTLVWRLRLAMMQKIGLIASFAVGILTGVISIVRFVTLEDVIQTSDFNYVAVPLVLLSLAEPTSAIVCACVPILRPLLARWAWPGSAGGPGTGGSVPSAGGHSAKRHIAKPSVSTHPPTPQSPTTPTVPQLYSCLE